MNEVGNNDQVEELRKQFTVAKDASEKINIIIGMCGQSIADTIVMLRDAKPDDRSEKDRRFAVVITEMEKAQAYFYAYITNQGVL